MGEKHPKVIDEFHTTEVGVKKLYTTLEIAEGVFAEVMTIFHEDGTPKYQYVMDNSTSGGTAYTFNSENAISYKKLNVEEFGYTYQELIDAANTTI